MYIGQKGVEELKTKISTGASREIVEGRLNFVDISNLDVGLPQILIVTEETAHLLRGYNFRSATRNLDLYLFFRLGSQRSVYQAMHRVGRAGDLCRRFVEQSVHL